MQSVTVLTTHGRRQMVKVENNKTVLSILETVCTKFKFDAKNYGLKHHNKLLDLSQMFRFSGIPNNATLEMVECDTANKFTQEQDILICLQLEDGSRVEGNFSSSSVLRSIITKLSSVENPSPVLVYMRSMYHGEQLDSVTLKDLGLSGRALLRLMNTDPETLKVQANISASLPQKPRDEIVESKAERSLDKKTAATTINVSDIKKLKQEDLSKEEKPEPMEIEEEERVDDTSKVSEVKNEELKPLEEAVKPETIVPRPESIIKYLDDAGTIVFALDSLQSSFTSEVPDSFFDITETDVKKLYRDLRNEVEQGENKPLMTSALRKLEEDKKVLNLLAQYKSTAIRILLPDRMVIQRSFGIAETVANVMQFVRSFLANPDIEFHLYVTPPKSILSPEETLVECKLVPSALLHFGVEKPLTDVVSTFLKPELLDKLSSGFSGSFVYKNEDQASNASSPSTSIESIKKPSSTSQLNFMPSKASNAGLSSGVIPKWFKPK